MSVLKAAAAVASRRLFPRLKKQLSCLHLRKSAQTTLRLNPHLDMFCSSATTSDGDTPDLDNAESRMDMTLHRELLSEYTLVALQVQQLLVIQPFQRDFRRKRPKEEERDHTLMMEETLGNGKKLKLNRKSLKIT